MTLKKDQIKSILSSFCIQFLTNNLKVLSFLTHSAKKKKKKNQKTL